MTLMAERLGWRSRMFSGLRSQWISRSCCVLRTGRQMQSL